MSNITFRGDWELLTMKRLCDIMDLIQRIMWFVLQETGNLKL